MALSVAQLLYIGLQSQIQTLKAEANALKRRTIADAKRHVVDIVVTAGIAFLGVFFAVLTSIVGLIALYVWLAETEGPVVALGVVGSTTAGVAILLFALTAIRASRRQDSDAADVRLSARLRTPRPTFADALKHDASKTVTAAADSVRATGRILASSSRETFLTTLALAVLAGFIAGRRLNRPHQ